MTREIQAITFDAYGTLIDPMGTTWEAISEILKRSHADADTEDFFGWIVDKVREGTRTPGFRSYLQLFRDNLTAAFEEFGVVGTPEDADLIFVHGRMRQPYPEVPTAIASLQQRYRTGIISNTDNKPLRENLLEAGLQFDFTVTSELMRAYKPSSVLFEEALSKLRLEPGQMAHVGDSPVEDIAPAKAMGMLAVWVNRQGATYPKGIPTPDFTVASLEELDEFLR